MVLIWKRTSTDGTPSESRREATTIVNSASGNY